MAVKDKVETWLKENALSPQPAKIPNTDWAFTFTMPSGLQMIAQSPPGRNDYIGVGCGINIDATQKSKLGSHAKEFIWQVRHDYLLMGIGFNTQPPDADIPDNVTCVCDVYIDGLNKNVFMRAVQEASSAGLLLILAIREFTRK